MTRLPVDVTIRAPSTRYLDELCRLKCAPELLDHSKTGHRVHRLRDLLAAPNGAGLA